MNINKLPIQWYIDLRKYGTTIHSGFSMELEKLIIFITKTSDIRDVIPYPRWYENADY